VIKYIFRHIVRAPAKSLLGMAVALLFTFVLGFLLNTVQTLMSEIDRLYDETIVYSSVRLHENFVRSRRPAGDTISILQVRDVLDMGIVTDMYLEGGAIGWLVHDPRILNPGTGFEILVGVDNLGHLMDDTTQFLGRDDPLSMQVEFAVGFDKSSFVHIKDGDISIVISQTQADSHNLLPGDSIYLVYYRPVLFRAGTWLSLRAIVIGIHDGGGLVGFAREGAVIPLATMEYMLEDHMGYTTFRFSIDPAYNRDFEDIEHQLYLYLQRLPRYPRRDLLTADIWDQELRFGVQALQQQVMLMQLIFPVIAAVGAIIGVGLAMLSMLQNAKNAATIRVLGRSRLGTFAMLWIGQVVLYVVGGLIGLLLIWVVGLRADFAWAVLPYLAGAVVGATVGVIMITMRAPLDMLQVRD